jgi:hypothetical protein
MKEKVDHQLLSYNEIVARRSSKLRENPDIILNEYDEIGLYMSTWSDEYKKSISSLSNLSEEPLGNSVRIFVTIIAYQEGKRIFDTLKYYAGQDIDKKLFEILIFDNHSISVDPDDTLENVKKFKNEHPDISVRYIHKIWQDTDIASMNNARKHVMDISLYAIYSRGETSKDHILISNDADCEGLSKNYLSSILDAFDTKSFVDALVTSIVVPFNVIVKPNLYAVLTLWDTIDYYCTKDSLPGIRGNSSAFRCSAYAAVGGHNPKGKIVEDLEIGLCIADGRKWRKGCIITLAEAKYTQDPRRHLVAMAARVPVNEMYGDVITRQDIRVASNSGLLEMIPNSLDFELLEEDIDSFWRAKGTGMYKWRGELYEQDFQNAMRDLGVVYKIENDRLFIKDMNLLLDRYQNEFGERPSVTHSTRREMNYERNKEIRDFFSTVTDNYIECRKNAGLV